MTEEKQKWRLPVRGEGVPPRPNVLGKGRPEVPGRWEVRGATPGIGQQGVITHILVSAQHGRVRAPPQTQEELSPQVRTGADHSGRRGPHPGSPRGQGVAASALSSGQGGRGPEGWVTAPSGWAAVGCPPAGAGARAPHLEGSIHWRRWRPNLSTAGTLPSPEEPRGRPLSPPLPQLKPLSPGDADQEAVGTSTPVCLSVQAPHPKACCTKPALDWGGSWSLLVTRRGRGAGSPLGTNPLYAPRPSPWRPPPSHTHRPQGTITLLSLVPSWRPRASASPGWGPRLVPGVRTPKSAWRVLGSHGPGGTRDAGERA